MIELDQEAQEVIDVLSQREDDRSSMMFVIAAIATGSLAIGIAIGGLIVLVVT